MTVRHPESQAHSDVLSYPVAPLDWMADASCRKHNPEMWHPEPGFNGTEAKSICAVCPVQPECLTYALTVNAPLTGIWGGLTTDQRAKTGLRTPRGHRPVTPTRPPYPDGVGEPCPDCGKRFRGLPQHRYAVHGRRATA